MGKCPLTTQVTEAAGSDVSDDENSFRNSLDPGSGKGVWPPSHPAMAYPDLKCRHHWRSRISLRSAGEQKRCCLQVSLWTQQWSYLLYRPRFSSSSHWHRASLPAVCSPPISILVVVVQASPAGIKTPSFWTTHPTMLCSALSFVSKEMTHGVQANTRGRHLHINSAVLCAWIAGIIASSLHRLCTAQWWCYCYFYKVISRFAKTFSTHKLHLYSFWHLKI